jgi:hypothetical protein
MIFVWIWAVIRFLGRIVIPPPAKIEPPRIDPKSPCIACGNHDSKVQYVVVSSKPGSVGAVRKGLLRITCNVCGAYYQIEPLFSRQPGSSKKIGADEVGGKEIQGLTT